MDELRQPLLDANATVEWTPEYMGKRMDDWLRNMGDWNISRRRYYGLPAADLRVRLRTRHRRGLEGGAHGARSLGARPARGAAAAVGRRGPDPLRGLRRDREPDHRRGRRLAGRGNRPVLDSRLGEHGVHPAGLCNRRGEGPDVRGSPRSRVLGGVVPGGLGVRDARADPALVLLAALHVRRTRRARTVHEGARLREDARRARARDARLLGEHDRGRRRVRSHGCGRHALAVLLAAAGSQPPLRVRART